MKQSYLINFDYNYSSLYNLRGEARAEDGSEEFDR